MKMTANSDAAMMPLHDAMLELKLLNVRNLEDVLAVIPQGWSVD